MNADAAEKIAVQALGWLASDQELMGLFLGATGSAPDDLRQATADPAFLISVLDFLMMDDAWVIRFCDDHSMPYETPMQARQHLPGGAQVHWT